MPLDWRPVDLQRAALGFSSPTPEEKELIWSYLSIPQAGILKATGGYIPAKLYRHAHHHPARTKMPAGGPRSGKSLFGSMEVVPWSLHSDLIWVAADSYDLARQEFEYIVEALLSLDWTEPRLISFPENKYQPCAVETVWGTLIETKSLKDPTTFVARAPDVVLICEPGLTSLTSVYRANERLTTKRGLLLMPGTFENAAPWMMEYWKKWKRWPNEDNAKSWSMPSWLNRQVFPLGLLDPEALKLRQNCETFDEFLLRYVGVPSTPPDLIMADTWKERIHVGSVKYTAKLDGDYRLLPAYVAIDPGWDGDSRYIALAIQVIPATKKIRVIDEVVGKGLTHEQVIARCMRREWWPVCVNGTIDPYAGNSNALGGNTPASVWARKEYGVRLELPKRLQVEELIRMIKSYLTGSNGWSLEVDASCERLRWEMQSWKRRRTLTSMGTPSKAGCDAIKALGYFLTHHQTGQVHETEPDFQVSDFSVNGSAGYTQSRIWS